MLPKLLTSIFGSRNDRLLKQYRRVVEQINTLEPQFEALDDAALRAKTDEFRQRIAQGASLDDLMSEAFAVVREGGKRSLKMRHFDVQYVGGMALHNGKIAEMRTGEGKTLMATLPVYLNALSGKGVHLVTVNDYLARRDAEWMGRLYGFLGLTVGVNVPGLTREEKQAAYAAGDSAEGRTAADNQTVRTVYVVGPDKKIKMLLAYPMTTGRDFDEILRVIDSMQLTAKYRVATPVNWRPGNDVVIAGSVTNEEAKKIYPEGWKEPKPYLRIVPQPGMAKP